jgi:hypothetical protein
LIKIGQVIGIVGKRLSYSIFLLMFFVIGFHLGTMYWQHYIDTGESFSEWLDMEKDCSKKFTIPYPEEYTCDERIKDYEVIKKYVWIEVLLIFIMSFFDYIKDKENHWVRTLWERMKDSSGE